ncbi:MAG: tRNA lysidine(34) synthetase TilS [Clostridia bacterium]|nr:tRNA lysidine(34) synthetase TilS [Clostridia bacterium]
MTAPEERGTLFQSAYRRFVAYVTEEGLFPHLSRGTLLALSGGADSLFLLHCLAALAREHGFPLCALHVNHGLRGADSDADEALCEGACRSLSVPFRAVRINVRAAADETGEGTEEAARRLRYAALEDELSCHRELSTLATAHNATDHLETVLHHLLRGGGATALVGIRPQRGHLVRPLLCLTAGEIREALAAEGIAYAVDATNADTAYTRNYLRHEILSRLERVNPNAEAAVLRMSEALLPDVLYLEERAEEAMARLGSGEDVSAAELLLLPEAILRRVIRRLYEAARSPKAATVAIEHTHVAAILRLLRRGGDFSYAVPDHLYAVRAGERFAFLRALPQKEEPRPPLAVFMGENDLGDGVTLTLTADGEQIVAHCFSFLHKIDTTVAISSDIIVDGLYVRGRLPGDAYRYGGHTHSLKKLYNARRIPLALRASYPILCDGAGILWLPAFPLRDTVQN